MNQSVTPLERMIFKVCVRPTRRDVATRSLQAAARENVETKQTAPKQQWPKQQLARWANPLASTFARRNAT